MVLEADSVLNLPGQTRMLDVVRRGLGDATDVRIAVSFTRCSGLSLLIDPLRDVVARRGQIRLLTSTYQAVTQPDALQSLLGIAGVETRVQDGPTGFHSKFWWFGGSGAPECWAGSSNMSKGGLDTSVEWNFRAIEPERLRRAAAQFDGLWERPDVFKLDEAFIKRYRLDWCERQVPPSAAPLASAGLSPFKANQAQLEALENLRRLRARGEMRAAVIAATGVGKTYLAALDVLQSKVRKVLYVSHRLEHLLQAKRAFTTILGAGRSYGVVGGRDDESHAEIIFATVQSLRNRPELAARAFEYLVIDEFHHAEAPSYSVLQPIIERSFLLGLTATPERQDGHDVLAWCGWNIAYEIRLPEAIDRGLLLPFHYFGIADETVEFEQIRWRTLSETEIGAALSIDARAKHILSHALERGFDGAKRAAVGFCAGVKHAEFMARSFNRLGQVAVALWSDHEVEAREAVYRRLEDPRDPLEWIFVADVLNEGVDIPAINTVLFLRPTESATIFLQQLGRGLRLFPGTEVLTVLDFVGHHRSAWLTLEALQDPHARGQRSEIIEGLTITPPPHCEVVLQRRTREILAKVDRFTNKREACKEAYRQLRKEVGHAPLPIDLWNRSDLPPLRDFRSAYKTWSSCRKENGDETDWERVTPEDHPARRFLAAIEADWQSQRVTPYALVWGMACRPDNPALGCAEFFERWPQWKVEQTPLETSNTWETVRKKLEPTGALGSNGLSAAVIEAVGGALLSEVEGRLLYTVNKDYGERHGGVIRTPADLTLFGRYSRPEIIRHFGTHYDPAKHNTGMLWFDRDGVIITKLDTSNAKKKHQYANRFIDPATFSWTSQNKQTRTNEAGRNVTQHRERGRRLHLFVQAASHQSVCYLGTVTCIEAQGDGPMTVTLSLDAAVPDSVMAELTRGNAGTGAGS